MIHTFWHGGPLSPLGFACIASFVARGHAVHVHAYEPLDLPPGATLHDAREIVATHDPMHRFSAPSTITTFADYFRYRLLHERGGWWVDTDVYCLTDTLPNGAYAWADQEPRIVNNAILKFPKGDSLCARLAALARERASGSSRWGALGPDLVTEVLGDAEPGRRAGTREAFYPVHWLEAHFLWLPEFREVVAERIANAQFLHCWAKALDLMGIDMGRTPPAGSFLADIVEPVRMRGSNAWHRFHTRRSIRRFLGQPWVKDYWVTRVGGRWSDLSSAGVAPATPPTVIDD